MEWLKVIKAIIVLLPSLVALIREGKIKDAAYDEVLEALASLFDTRIKAADAARQMAKDKDWINDPNDRANWNAGGVGTGSVRVSDDPRA